MGTDGKAAAIAPLVSFRVAAEVPLDWTGMTVFVHVHEYDYDNGAGKRVWSSQALKLSHSVNGTLHRYATTEGVFLYDLFALKWAVATVELGGRDSDVIQNVELFLGYDSRKSTR